MAESSASSDANTEYAIIRRPNLQVVTKGAKVHYACEWKAPSNPPESASDGYWGPRDGIRWYSYGSQRPNGFGQSQVVQGPLQTYWDLTWEDEPGQYVVIAEIRRRGPGVNTPTYCRRSQQIGDAPAMLEDWLDNLLKHGDGPSPEQVEKEIARYRAVLDEIAKKHPPPNPAKHKELVDNWADLADRLRALLAPSDGRRRLPIRAIHLEDETQAQRPLLLFLTELPDVTHPTGKGAVTKKQWSLVDWTDCTHPRFRNHYEGEGDTAKEAILACLSAWDWGNGYPKGHVRFEVPPPVRAIIGGDVRRQMETNGTTITEEIVVVFQWIAIGTMLIGGFFFIFVAVPTLTSLAMGTSMLASTAGAVFSVAQRWRDGLFDWKADAIDGLTILGNLVGAGAWVRGARVRILGKEAKLDCVFIGARVATDAAQGILIAESRLSDLDALMKDASLPPDERARKILALLSELTAFGLMTAVSFRASLKEAEALSEKPKHLKSDDPRANVPDDILNKLTKPSKPGDPILDTTTPPIVEGHTKKTPQRKATVQTGVVPAPTARTLDPLETDFAKAYQKDAHPWQTYAILKNEIELIDKDGLRFRAIVSKDGTLSITIITVYDPAETPELVYELGNQPKTSTVLRAKVLYPRMYKHFKQVGTEITALKGPWAWKNYKMAAEVYEELKKTMDPTEAAKVAVKAAKTFVDYHANTEITQGLKLTKVVFAKINRRTERFNFRIEKE